MVNLTDAYSHSGLAADSKPAHLQEHVLIAPSLFVIDAHVHDRSAISIEPHEFGSRQIVSEI
jgi:hypothetical protein